MSSSGNQLPLVSIVNKFGSLTLACATGGIPYDMYIHLLDASRLIHGCCVLHARAGVNAALAARFFPELMHRQIRI